MGQRANARGLDLNRDFIKLEAPETRALVRFFNTWKPHLFIDTHTTNGSHHRYTITYEGPKNPAGDPTIIAFARGRSSSPRSRPAFEKATGLQAYYYGNFNRDHTKWTTYPAEGRYGTTYFGLRNRLSVLSEAYSYAPFKDRVLATRDFVRECLTQAAAHKDEILKLLGDAERAVVEAGQSPGDDRSGGDPLRGRGRWPAPSRSSATTSARRTAGGSGPTSPRTIPAQLMHDFAADRDRRPAIRLPASRPAFGEALATLQRHGIDVQELREDIELDVEVYRVEEVGKQTSRGLGSPRPRRAPRQAPHRDAARAGRHAGGEDGPAAGQPGGLPARAALGGRPGDLEASSTDAQGRGRFPGRCGCPEPTPLTTTGAEAAGRGPQARPADHLRHGPGRFPRRRRASRARRSRRPGSTASTGSRSARAKLYKVEAATGRSRAVRRSRAALAKGLKRPARPRRIDRPTRSRAGTSFDMDPAAQGLPVRARRRPLLRHVRRLDRRSA